MKTVGGILPGRFAPEPQSSRTENGCCHVFPRFSTIVTLSLVLVSLSRGSADELPGSERPLTAGEIAALIRKLESRKFREREEASRALEAAGDDALNALRQASEQSNDPDGLCSSAHRRWTAAGQSNGARVGHLDMRASRDAQRAEVGHTEVN